MISCFAYLHFREREVKEFFIRVSGDSVAVLSQFVSELVNLILSYEQFQNVWTTKEFDSRAGGEPTQPDDRTHISLFLLVDTKTSQVNCDFELPL
jgi:hypothetical protein